MMSDQKHRLANRRYQFGVVVLLITAVLIGWSCTRDEVANENQAESTEIVRQAERGPVKLEVTCDRTEISIADQIALKIKATAEESVLVQMPEFGESLDRFQIRDYTNPPVQTLTEDGKTSHVWEQTYDLDIFLSGEYAIPAITVTFEDARLKDQDPILGEVTTEPITVKVASLLEGDVDPTQFVDVKEPVELPGSSVPEWMIYVAGAVILVVVAMILLVFKLAATKKVRMIRIAPHEWAFDQLRALIDEDLVEQGLTKEFYYRLNEIVRVYIEYRYGLMAPERTTEEFLAELRSSSSPLRPSHQELLQPFLLACDEVKYALYEPGAEEIEKVFNTARDFVDQTADRNQQQPVETGKEEAA